MKVLFFVLLAAVSSMSFGQSRNSKVDQYFKAVVYMIHETTPIRIQAIARGDYNKACNVVGNLNRIDTQSYYISFEIFKDDSLSEHFYKEVGPFIARNYEDMYRQELPLELHFACVEGNRSKIQQVINQIKDIYNLE